MKTIHAVCGTCHYYERQYSKKGPHDESAGVAGTPRCIDCHGNHRNTIPAGGLLANGDKQNCGSCHQEGEEGYRIALELKDVLEQASFLLANFQKTKETQQADTMEAMFLDGEYSNLRNGFSILRKATHSLDTQEARSRLAELQETAKNALLYQQKVLSREEEKIGPLILILGGVAMGVGLLSLSVAFVILKWKERQGRNG